MDVGLMNVYLDKHLKSYFIQKLQVYHIIIRRALDDEGFTSIDPLVPVRSQGHDNIHERCNATPNEKQ